MCSLEKQRFCGNQDLPTSCSPAQQTSDLILDISIYSPSYPTDPKGVSFSPHYSLESKFLCSTSPTHSSVSIFPKTCSHLWQEVFGALLCFMVSYRGCSSEIAARLSLNYLCGKKRWIGECQVHDHTESWPKGIGNHRKLFYRVMRLVFYADYPGGNGQNPAQTITGGSGELSMELVEGRS